jgi:2-dehydro-3-deoxyphosphogluconate aldolase/(4S)-4-hydroxy-2-oxoglutarate aldolase
VLPDVARACAERAVPCYLGAATPTEVLAAHRAGAAAVKVFPAAQLGGPAYLRAVRSVFPGIALMPTGGIGVENIAAYMAAGALCVGMGGKLVDEDAIAEGRLGDVAEAAGALLGHVSELRGAA